MTREGERDAEDSADGGEGEAFSDELSNQTGAAGAEGGAHGEFPAAGSHARKKKIGEIDADDEKDESRRRPRGRRENGEVCR